MLNRRSERRMMCADMVGVHWEDQSGRGHSLTALLEDISHSGACLQTDIPLPMGVQLELQYRKAKLEGTVSYCFFREIGYWVGVQFNPDKKWSERQFRPKHMLDVKKLLHEAPPPAAARHPGPVGRTGHSSNGK